MRLEESSFVLLYILREFKHNCCYRKLAKGDTFLFVGLRNQQI